MSELIEKKYYSIGEVAKLIDEAPSLIRFWEKEFPQLKPTKSAKGTRKYSSKDVELIQLIHFLLKVKKLTIEGAKAHIRKQSKLTEQPEIIGKMYELKLFLLKLKNELDKK